uniref:Uncharacterized protein n=1 Tax=Daphnia galeata TaxID=27404 RepID=A0A8J2WHG1_9CRUS|nr:unnamed protein product [Daphnia galeata]
MNIWLSVDCGFKKLAKEVDVTKDTESEFCDTSIEAGNKEMNSALAYLQHIDPSGNLLCAVTTTKFADDTNKQRKERIDRMTTAMNLLEYKEYHKKIKPAGKFKDWLLKDSPNPEVALISLPTKLSQKYTKRQHGWTGANNVVKVNETSSTANNEAIRLSTTNNSFSSLFGAKLFLPTGYRTFGAMIYLKCNLNVPLTALNFRSLISNLCLIEA